MCNKEREAENDGDDDDDDDDVTRVCLIGPNKARVHINAAGPEMIESPPPRIISDGVKRK